MTSTIAGCETVNVVVVELDRVEVSPAQRTLVEGQTDTVKATLRGPDGETLTGRTIVWTSSNPAVASLSGGAGSQVVVSARSAGQATVRATVEGRSGVAQVEVLVGPSLVLSPATLTISGRQGEASAGVDVGITNGGNGSVSGLSTQVVYAAAGPAGWLTVGLNGTTVPTSMTLTASAVTLTPGTYSATVRVTSPTAGGLTVDLPVDFVVQPPPPTIVLESDAVGLAATFGEPFPAFQDVGISNGGAGTLTGLGASVTYPPGGRQGWLTATLANTQAPTTLRVSAVATGLPAGTYTARVAVTSPVARVSPVFLDVSFRVAPPGGSPAGGGGGGAEGVGGSAGGGGGEGGGGGVRP